MTTRRGVGALTSANLATVGYGGRTCGRFSRRPNTPRHARVTVTSGACARVLDT